MKTLLLCLVLLATNAIAFAQGSSSLAFVTEFVRELGSTENLRAQGERELKEDMKTSSEKIIGMIRHSTRVQLDLRTNIALLSGMHLDSRLDFVRQNIIQVYKDKLNRHQQSIDITSQFLDAPKPRINYGKLAAEMPKITAAFEHEDKALFTATSVVFIALVDTKPDSKGHLSHLVITKAERDQLIHDLKLSFGSKLNSKDQDQNYTVSSAALMLEFLQKDFKCSDEPW